MIRIAFDVVKGMVYLQNKGVVHRDLAARNILVEDGSNVAKVRVKYVWAVVDVVVDK